MPKSNIYVSLEIGTSKICVVVGEGRGDGSLKILGVGQAPSRGVRKGEIVDLETLQTCLHDALVRAEEKSDVMIRNVVLAVSGPHVQSVNNRGTTQIPEDQSEITYDDLEEVKDIARRDVDIPADHVFIHSIIRHYYVDGGERVLNPVGMLGGRLDADYHIIHGMRARIQNAIRCVREMRVEVADVVFGPVAAAQVLVNREAKEQGALVIDIGGGTTDYVLYSEGSIAHSGSIGLGGDHITNDLAIVLRLTTGKAERLKVTEGCAIVRDEDFGDMIDLEDDHHFAGRPIDRGTLNEVIHLRVCEIFEQVARRLDEAGFLGRISAGVYLCGGTTLLPGLREVAEDVLDLPVQRASAAPISGLTATFENPQFVVPIGLIRYAQLVDNERPGRSPLAAVGRRLIEMIGSARIFG